MSNEQLSIGHSNHLQYLHASQGQLPTIYSLSSLVEARHVQFIDLTSITLKLSIFHLGLNARASPEAYIAGFSRSSLFDNSRCADFCNRIHVKDGLRLKMSIASISVLLCAMPGLIRKSQKAVLQRFQLHRSRNRWVTLIGQSRTYARGHLLAD